MDSAAVEGEGNPVLYRGAAATFVDAIKSGVFLRPQLWGLADVLVALLLSLLIPSVVVGVLLAVGAPKTGTIVILASLISPWVGFGLWPAFATRRQGNGPRIDLGLTFTRDDLRWGILRALHRPL